jgi:hypothetical protein
MAHVFPPAASQPLAFERLIPERRRRLHRSGFALGFRLCRTGTRPLRHSLTRNDPVVASGTLKSRITRGVKSKFVPE